MTGHAVAISPATHHAEALLRAWVVGDWSKLDTELHEVAGLPCEAVNGFEEERVDLLKALAVQLRSATSWRTADTNDVRMQLFAKLLQNLTVSHSGIGPSGAIL